jgi:hypothetical protein
MTSKFNENTSKFDEKNSQLAKRPQNWLKDLKIG